MLFNGIIISVNFYFSKAVRFSNNSIHSFDGFSRALYSVIEMPETLEWIDLSFNDFTKIDEVSGHMILCKGGNFPRLDTDCFTKTQVYSIVCVVTLLVFEK